MKCKGITLKGNPCKKKTLTEYCHLHENNLPKKIEEIGPYHSDMMELCPICLDEIIEKKSKKILSGECGHSMHIQCAKGMKNIRCPLCRKDIPELNNIIFQNEKVPIITEDDMMLIMDLLLEDGNLNNTLLWNSLNSIQHEIDWDFFEPTLNQNIPLPTLLPDPEPFEWDSDDEHW